MRDKLKKITVCAVFSALAAVTGILESFLPLRFIFPIPGVKLGIANIFIVFAYLFYGMPSAFAVCISRILIVFLFSGSAVSLFMSLGGGLFSFLSLCAMMKFYEKYFSFVGVSAVTAVFHGLGQIVCAYFIVGSAVMFYLPILLLACAATGIFTGTLMNISKNKLAVFM